MEDHQSVSVAELVDVLDLSFVEGEEFIHRQITSSEISRPGLILTGRVDDYPSDRIQLIGYTEWKYIMSQNPDIRLAIARRLCQPETPAIIIARCLVVPEELIDVAKLYGIPILTTRSKTSRALANVANFLEGRLAERVSKHGVFIEVYGMGVMLTGSSGVGKSETALELVQRGHRLIADDRVELYMLDELTLMGEAPEILRDLMEIRGLGIVDVRTLYGVSAVRRRKRLELIIDLIIDEGKVEYDRLGNKVEYEKIFEVDIPKIQIPVKVGRSLSIIIESASMNFRAQEMGHNTTEIFTERLNELIRYNSRQYGDDFSD